MEDAMDVECPGTPLGDPRTDSPTQPPPDSPAQPSGPSPSGGTEGDVEGHVGASNGEVGAANLEHTNDEVERVAADSQPNRPGAMRFGVASADRHVSSLPTGLAPTIAPAALGLLRFWCH